MPATIPPKKRPHPSAAEAHHTDELDHVERFERSTQLVISDPNGAVVREVASAQQ